MPGPNGEQCKTCYFFDQITDGPYGYCRNEHAEAWLDKPGTSAPRNWPRVHGDLDWSGDWLDRNAPAAGTPLATGGAITTAGTAYSIPGGSTWTYYNPTGGLSESSIMYNVTLTDSTLSWSIPGTFPPGTQFIADYSVFGSITYANSAQAVLWTLGGTDNVPFSNDVIQRIDITNQTDDISLPWGFSGGPATSSQTGDVRVLVQSVNAENITVNSLFFQINVRIL